MISTTISAIAPDISAAMDGTAGPCRLECCRTVITTYRRLVKRFLLIWQHHHLMIVSTIAPTIL